MRFRKCDYEALNARSSIKLHCVTRVVDKDFKLGDREKAMFVKFLRIYESFCGLEVLSFVIMSNHIHILVKIPKRSEEVIEDVEFLRRLKVLYGKDAAVLEETLEGYREAGSDDAAEAFKARFTYRMGNISEFMKSLKQRFSRWFNRIHKRSGTLWESRYSVTAVGDGWASKVVSAYIDLNPLRAGMVSDPATYRFSSYGEAVAKNGLARRRLLSVMASVESGASLGSNAPRDGKQALAQYRLLLSEEGAAVDQQSGLQPGESMTSRRKKAKGFSKAEVKKILKQGGELSLVQMLRCKTRYFTAGCAIGSAAYVRDVVETLQSGTGSFKNRKAPAKRIPVHQESDEQELASLRNLQKSPISL